MILSTGFYKYSKSKITFSEKVKQFFSYHGWILYLSWCNVCQLKWWEMSLLMLRATAKSFCCFRPCISEKPKPESKKPLMIYPGYIDKKHPSNSPPCNKMPHVVRRGRIRPTDDESYRETQYIDLSLIHI